jgi:hypothetical protein
MPALDRSDHQNTEACRAQNVVNRPTMPLQIRELRGTVAPGCGARTSKLVITDIRQIRGRFEVRIALLSASGAFPGSCKLISDTPYQRPLIPCAKKGAG